MKKTSIVVHQNYAEDVIKTLHETGMMEIIDISKEMPETLEDAEKAGMHPDAGVCTTYELRVSRLIDILDKIRVKKSGLKAMLNPQLPEIKDIEDSTLDELYSYTEGILEEIEKNILERDQRISELNEQKEKIDFEIKQITYLLDFKLDLSDIGESGYVVVKAGLTNDLPTLENEMKSLDKVSLFSKQFGSGKKKEWSVVVAAFISEKEKIEKIFREKISEFDLKNLSGSPKDVLKDLEKELKNIEKETKEIVSKLRVYAGEQLNDLLALREEIRLERVRKEVSKNFVQTSSTFIINGWVLERDVKDLKNALTVVSDDHVACSFETPSANPDNPPTYLENPGWASAFKTFLEMFATPRYNELNPTVIMGIFFVLFFGIMLGDAGYGIVLIILSLIGYFKFGKHSELLHDWGIMGIFLGITTTVVGFLTNGFFGDFIPRFIYGDATRPLYSASIGGVSLPVEPLSSPLTILTIALVCGLVHLNVGILLGIYQTYKLKEYKSLVTQKFCWIPLQLGGGMLVGYFLLGWELSSTMMYIAGILTIVGLVLLFAHAGPIGFFDITGYVGDWLSYARLLALGLATAGMALAFNVVAQLLPDMIPVVGIILMPIILIIAHMANLGLNALGAGVHSLRLQYVEFFNRFYEGGGREFSPFKINRKYTRVKDEKIE